MEFLDEAKVSFPFEIFATDISETAIEKARAGMYAGAALAHVSPQRLARFFTRSERGYQIGEGHPRRMRFCQAQRGAGPAFLQAGPDQLLQRADLPGRRIAAQGLVDSALRPQAGRLPGARPIGKHRHAFRVISSGGEDPQDLLPAAGRECAGAAAERRPPRRRPGGSPARELPRAGTGLDVQREADRLVLAEYAPSGRHHRRRDEHRSGPGPHRSVPRAFAGRADPESSETGARRLDCGPG